MRDQLQILLIEDNPGDARLIQELLGDGEGAASHLEHADRLLTGLERLSRGGIDVVLLDLELPDSAGSATFTRVWDQAPRVPIIALTGLDDESLAVEMVRKGAQDYIIKGQVDGNLLTRSIHYAVERKRAEEAIKLSEARYRSLVETQTDIIARSDLSGNLSFVNDSYCRTFGIPREQLLGGSWGATVVPEDLPVILQVVEAIKQPPYRKYAEIRNVTPDGIRWFSWDNSAVLDEQENIIELQGVGRDITERKRAEEALRESEEKFRSIVETTGEWIWQMDVHGRHLYSNPAIEKILGYTPSEVVGGLALELMALESRREVEARLPQLIQDKRGWTGWVLEWQHKDGAARWLESNAIPILGADGQLLCYRGTDRDITERKRAEEQVRASLREKEVLLKEIHHRVKNNLQVIVSLLGLQAKYIQDPRALEMFEESQNRIRSMALVHERLYQSQNLAQVDLADYVQNLVAHLFRSFESDPQAIALKVDVRDVSLAIDAAIPCGLIINELVSNCLKHAFPDRDREGEREICVEMHSENGRVTLVVRDNGVGFPQGVDYRNTESLGMQLVVILTQQLGGAIELDTRHGTAFKITFEAEK